MASIGKAGARLGHSGGVRTLQMMYEAARKEVFADPAAALRKYQPGWAMPLPGPVRKGSRHR